MEDFEGLISSAFVFLILSIFAGSIFYRLFSFLFGAQFLRLTIFTRRKRLSKYDRMAIERIVSRYVTFYEPLSDAGKVKFLNRLIDHYTSKNFVGMHGQLITREVKVLVSAGVAQLTFGLRNSFLSHFSDYYIYPRRFRLNKNMPVMHGATHPGGSIHFNWVKVKYGYENSTDGINLVIHEFAHALVLQHRVGSLLDMEWGIFYEEWHRQTMRTLRKAKEIRLKHFRRDVLEMPTELFPVLVEEFFECPEEFIREFPQIYSGLAAILQLDPLNSANDYRTTENPYQKYAHVYIRSY